jgi:hypothetical protein
MAEEKKKDDFREILLAVFIACALGVNMYLSHKRTECFDTTEIERRLIDCNSRMENLMISVVIGLLACTPIARWIHNKFRPRKRH